MTQPTHIRAADPDDDGATVKATKQVVYRAHAMDKVEVLARILQAEGRGLTIVFARTKRTAAKVADDLAARGFAAAPLHGDLGQGAREQALRAFRNGKVDVLVATDVAARGIDVTNVTHVVNYQCPEDEKTYLHRIGRTGRAGATGIAVTFVDWDDLHRWAMIDRTLDLGIPAPVETYSTSPHLFEELDIPAGTKGTLPRSARTREGLGAEVVEDLGETGRRNAPSGRDGARSGERPARESGGRGGRTDRAERPERSGGERTGGTSGERTSTERPERTERSGGSSRPERAPRSGRGDRPQGGGSAGPGAIRLASGSLAGPAAGSGGGPGTASAAPAPSATVPDAGPAGGPGGPAAGGPEGDASDAPRRRRRRGGRGRSGGASGAGAGAGEQSPQHSA